MTIVRFVKTKNKCLACKVYHHRENNLINKKRYDSELPYQRPDLIEVMEIEIDLTTSTNVHTSFYISVIPLFNTGHESPEPPRIDFFLIRGGGGIREGSLNFFSPIVMFYESVPIQIRCRYEYSGESAKFGWNRGRIHYHLQINIRTCCTKVKESITNQLRICRMQHELTEIRDDSPRFARFSLKIVIKKGPYMLRSISSKMNGSRIDPAT